MSVFCFDVKMGVLSFIDCVLFEGNDFCYFVLLLDGKYFVMVNYLVVVDLGGSFVVFLLCDDGVVG